jgi:DNA modification methylase
MKSKVPAPNDETALAMLPQQLTVEYQSVFALKPYPQNARTHSKKQIWQIANSIKEFAFNSPIVVDSQNTIIAGHGRQQAAKLLGMDLVPTVRVEHLTDEQIRAYVLAENRVAENAGWDRSVLAIELQHLMELDDFDINLTGFESPEIDLIIEEASPKNEQQSEMIEVPPGPSVSRLGDLWALGKHRVICANGLEEASFSSLMGKRKAQVVFTDPPYNIPIEGNVCGKGSIHHREFPMAVGEMKPDEFANFLVTVFDLLGRFSTAGAIIFVCIDWRHIAEMLNAGSRVFAELLNLCVWVKPNGGQGSFYRSRHELIFVFKNRKGKHRNNVQLGQFGRYRTNVWEYPGVNTLAPRTEEGRLATLHPTVKPLTLVADALLDCSARGDVVLDAFLGSGTTLLAAERVGRSCYGIEIDPVYVDVAIRRWQKLTGEHAIHASGKSFDEMAESRA